VRTWAATLFCFLVTVGIALARASLLYAERRRSK
jgi:hypothetical protein